MGAPVKKNKPAVAAAREVRISEEEILDRLGELQEAIHLPSEVWDFLVFSLCPDSLSDRPPPDEPTDALPGTAAKIAVMAARLAAGQTLFHGDDARIEDNDRIYFLAARLRNGAALRVSELPVGRQTHAG